MQKELWLLAAVGALVGLLSLEARAFPIANLADQKSK
jgi:hypothetical protein